MTTLDTSRTPNFRQIHFDSIDECAGEVRRILDADADGRLITSGNWTPGQILAHIAAWIEYAYEGFPVPPPPRFIRWILRLQLRRILRGSMPRGVRIPKVPGGTVGADDLSTPDAAARLLRALDRLASSEEARFDSPAFGPMSHADRVTLNLRHAELHLGFLFY